MTFKLRGDRLAYVQVDGRHEVELAPLAQLELPVGLHRLKWRLTRDDPWQRDPTIKLENEDGYHVRVGADGPILTLED